MKKKITILAAVLALFVSGGPALAGDGHDHGHENEKKPHAKKVESKKKKPSTKSHEHKEGEEEHHDDKDHKDEDGHNHKKESKEGAGADHGHDEEGETEAKNVGPEKGVTSFDEEIGFKMSAEALKTFSVEKIALNGAAPWTVPTSAILITGEEKSVYRVRNDTFKRIDVTVLSKNKSESVVQSDELNAGDSLVTKGVGDIRVAEVDVTSGESGHSH